MNALIALPEPSPLAHALLEQYFNTHCREQGIAVPPPADIEQRQLPLALQRRLVQTRQAPFALSLHNGLQLVGIVLQPSPIGWHRLDRGLWLVKDHQWQVIDDACQLADLIADHLAASAIEAGGPARAARLKQAMRNSIAHAHRYHQQSPLPAPCAFVRAEQCLRQGHVFHVTSKATEGFDEADLQRYAPELGARFRLHYFAVAPSHCLAQGVFEIDPSAHAEARHLLHGQPSADWPLLPCHPWQAAHLLEQPAIAACLDRGDLVSLGPLGEVAIPTSSVRTVWLPQQARFLKLALSIRITNFIRDNPGEQVQRALDASRALAGLPSKAINTPSFRVLLETGAHGLLLDDARLLGATTVLQRHALQPEAMSRFQVMAGVLEGAGADIGLSLLLREAAHGGSLGPGGVRAWWRRYLDITLRPLLALFLEHGAGLEAHLQNSLVRFDEGWPAAALVRDMEGATVSRGSAAAASLPADSAALYDDDQAWHRLQYYLLVNHLGQVAAGLARCTEVDEQTLWDDTAACLSATDHPRILQLLRARTLPAKANLLSSFSERGERPLYVPIVNPLRRGA